MFTTQDLSIAAFVWAATNENPSIQFIGHIAKFGFKNVASANAALIAYETGGVVEAKVFSKLRDSLFRRIRGGV